jgi:hypothetical protein
MFERDKADLRALGVPIETAPIDRFADDRQGYRIDPAAYDLPEARPLARGARRPRRRRRRDRPGDAAAGGLRKLEVDAGRPASPAAWGEGGARGRPRRPAPRGPRRGAGDPDRVRFRYRAASGATATRTVDPHALVHRRGRWYLVGRDHDREARARLPARPRSRGRSGRGDPRGLRAAAEAPRRGRRRPRGAGRRAGDGPRRRRPRHRLAGRPPRPGRGDGAPTTAGRASPCRSATPMPSSDGRWGGAPTSSSSAPTSCASGSWPRCGGAVGGA